MDKHFLKWLLYAPLGMLIIGTGLCVTIEAGFLKFARAEQIEWIKQGTLGLVIFMSGLAVFGRACIERMHYERRLKKQGRGGSKE
jgi:integral membrane sensor domain MASE1